MRILKFRYQAYQFLMHIAGFNDISYYGGGIEGLPTPNIDSIGTDGVGFTNGYAGHATCAPSRAAIMTGRCVTRMFLIEDQHT